MSDLSEVSHSYLAIIVQEEVRETDDKSTLNNGFTYTIDAFGRVIRVEGEFPSASMAAAHAVVAQPAARLRDVR